MLRGNEDPGLANRGIWASCGLSGDGVQGPTGSRTPQLVLQLNVQSNVRVSDHSTAKVDPIVGVEYVHVL